jgi:hypothetical protein
MCLLLVAFLPAWVGAGETAHVDAPHPLQDLVGAMVTSSDLLRQGVTGEQTSRVQQDIIERLDGLIASLETAPGAGETAPVAQEQPGGQQPSGTIGRPGRPAEESVLSAPAPGRGPIQPTGPQGGEWLPQLPPTEQKRVADTFTTGRLPPRYRELLRQYSKRLTESERPEN